METSKIKIPENGVLPVWQPIGKSTNHLTKLISEEFGVKTSHTGTLDPMAEGVVIVLCGEQRLKKIELASWKKTYEFEITFGIQTDSFDGLGLITKCDFKPVDRTELEKKVLSFEGPYTQTVPIYSAIKYKGQKLFLHANAGTDVTKLPEKSGTIYSISLLSFQERNLHELIHEIISKINKVEGELRQEVIVNRWKDLQKKTETNFSVSVAKIHVENSRGLYVRSLSQDICNSVGQIGFVSELIRTANGIYTKNDAYNP